MTTKRIDLNVVYRNKDQLLSSLNQILKIGYHLAAVSVDYSGSETITGPELKALLTDLENEIDTSLLTTEGLTYKQWTRINCVADSAQAVTNFVSNAPHTEFDLVGIAPSSVFALKKALEQKDTFDLISIVPGDSLIDFWGEEDTIAKLVEVGKPIEICYSGMVADSSVRNEAIASLKPLWDAFKENKLRIILSSHGKNEMDFRGPADVANIANLWNVSNGDAVKCVSAIPFEVITNKYKDEGKLYAQPVVELVGALGMKVARKRQGSTNRRTKRRRKKST